MFAVVAIFFFKLIMIAIVSDDCDLTIAIVQVQRDENSAMEHEDLASTHHRGFR